MSIWLTDADCDQVAAEICAQENLVIIDDASTGFGWCSKVVDAEGKTHYLKVITEDAMFVDFKRQESQVLALGQADEIFPRFRELRAAPLVLLVEDPGNAIATGNDYLTADQLLQAGSLFRKLHDLPLVPGVMTGIDRIIKTDYQQPVNDFEARHFDEFRKLSTYMINQHAHEEYLLHGDPHPANIVITEAGRLYLIDPHGLKGSRCYDLARVASYETDPWAAYQLLLEGYGRSSLPEERKWLALTCFQAQHHNDQLGIKKGATAGEAFLDLAEQLNY